MSNQSTAKDPVFTIYKKADQLNANDKDFITQSVANQNRHLYCIDSEFYIVDVNVNKATFEDLQAGKKELLKDKNSLQACDQKVKELKDNRPVIGAIAIAFGAGAGAFGAMSYQLWQEPLSATANPVLGYFFQGGTAIISALSAGFSVFCITKFFNAKHDITKAEKKAFESKFELNKLIDERLSSFNEEQIPGVSPV